MLFSVVMVSTPLDKSQSFNEGSVFTGLLPLSGGCITSTSRTRAEAELRPCVGGLTGHGLHPGQLGPRLHPRHHRYPRPRRHRLDCDELGGSHWWRHGVHSLQRVLILRREIEPAKIS